MFVPVLRAGKSKDSLGADGPGRLERESLGGAVGFGRFDWVVVG